MGITVLNAQKAKQQATKNKQFSQERSN